MKNSIKLSLSHPGLEPLSIYCNGFTTLPATNQIFIRFDDDRENPADEFMTEFYYNKNLSDGSRNHAIYQTLDAVVTSQTSVLLTGTNSLNLQTTLYVP